MSVGEYIRKLKKQGKTWEQIRKLAKCSNATIQLALRGEEKTTAPRVARKQTVISEDLPKPSPGPFNQPTHRRHLSNFMAWLKKSEPTIDKLTIVKDGEVLIEETAIKKHRIVIGD